MDIYVCDMIMGAGKTTAAINRMIEDKDSNYIFITPYKREVDRIVASCKERDFVDPQNRGKGKLDDLHNLFRKQRNIASTHALFKRYNKQTLELIRAGNYKLILDEVFDVIEKIDIHKDDINRLLIKDRIIEVDENNVVHWIDDTYEGDFRYLRDYAINGNLILIDNHLMLWVFPIEVFKSFKEVIILTYMFDAQLQKYYFDMYGIKAERIGTEKRDGSYYFSPIIQQPDYVKSIPQKIHIFEDNKLNKIGDNEYSLSKSWFERELAKRNKPLVKKLKNNLYNLFNHKFDIPADQRMWTTYKLARSALSGKGYTKGFLSYNMRATNEYRHKTLLAYCANVYINPYLKNYLIDHGAVVLEEQYALSELIQWIWRAAIRDGGDIWIYIPSSRMRRLLKEWLEEFKEGGETQQ